MTDTKNLIFSWLTNGVEPSRTNHQELADAILYGSPAQSPARRAATPIAGQEWAAVEQNDIDGIQKPVPPRADGINGAVRAAGQGVLGIGSYLDEMDAATNATLAPVFDPLLPDSFEKLPGETWSERYDQALEIQRRDSREYNEDHPYLSTSLKLAGGVGSAAALLRALPSIGNYALGNTGASIAGRVASGTGAGAGTGIVQGYGAGEGGAENRSSEAQIEALWGAGAGAVAVPLASGLGRLGSAAYRKFFGTGGDVPVPSAPANRAPGMAAEKAQDGGELASGRVGLYNHPARPQRPFEVDYPAKEKSYAERGIADENGKILQDIEGYDFDGNEIIAGRRYAGQADSNLSTGELGHVVERTTGTVPLRVARGSVRGDHGITLYDKASRRPGEVLTADDVSPEDYPLLLAHETGHVVDQASGERFSLGMKGMSPEEIARMAKTRASGQGLSPQEIAR